MWKIDFPDMKPFLRILLPAALCGLLLGDKVTLQMGVGFAIIFAALLVSELAPGKKD